MTAKIDIGFSAADRAAVAGALSKVLADAYALYLKTHGYHWNVRGPTFPALHTLFEGQYQEEWAALDDIAERIRALGELAPHGYGAFGNLSSIRDGDSTKNADGMVGELMADNETILATISGAFKIAENAGDQATMDLLNARTAAHGKHAWMLRATLGGQ
ncbi:MAG TPA: DNA starvation/stationary phase protection protein [Caulobacteraceae bacterium]|jgi:starvation-inducible DNA-binding protein